MKHYFFLLALLLVGGPFCTHALAQSETIVMTNSGKEIGVLVDESEQFYLVRSTETEWVVKADHTTDVRYAEAGQGYLLPTCQGSINVRRAPNTYAPIVDSWKIPEDEPADIAECMGKSGQWFKVKMPSGKVGYVREDLVRWSAISIGMW